MKKFQYYLGKRVLTPTFGDDNLDKKQTNFKRFQEKSFNQDSFFDIFDVELYKKDKFGSHHPKISRKSPLFDKFGKRNPFQLKGNKIFSENLEKNESYHKFEKNDDKLMKNEKNEELKEFTKNRIIFNKREFSAKNPRISILKNDQVRMMTPQSKNINTSKILNNNFIINKDIRYKKQQVSLQENIKDATGFFEIIENLKKVYIF